MNFDKYYNDLDFLLEKSFEIKKSIDKALNSLKEWFLEKINMVKEKVTNVKKKILKIEDPEKQPKVKTAFSKLQGTAINVIDSCKQGIHAVTSKNLEKAREIKEKTMTKLMGFSENTKKLAAAIGGGVILAGGAIAGQKIIHKAKENHEYRIRKELRNY